MIGIGIEYDKLPSIKINGYSIICTTPFRNLLDNYTERPHHKKDKDGYYILPEYIIKDIIITNMFKTFNIHLFIKRKGDSYKYTIDGNVKPLYKHNINSAYFYTCGELIDENKNDFFKEIINIINSIIRSEVIWFDEAIRNVHDKN